MKKRIAKKVKDDPKRYRGPQIAHAAKRLGKSIMAMGIDWAEDHTVIHIYNGNATDTGPLSATTLNEPTKPKTAFNHRTGQAPTTPHAIPVTNHQEAQAINFGLVDAMTLPDLREFAKAKGLKGYSTMKKAELVALLKG